MPNNKSKKVTKTMNEIKLKGVIRNLKPSHTINGIEYYQADMTVPRKDGKEDIIAIKFKKFVNLYKDGDEVELVGNIRSYSQQLGNGKSKVSIYVFTYQDLPDEELFDEASTNEFHLDGRICKLDDIRTTNSGKQNIHFILANNIFTNDGSQKINNYLPCVAWGKLAREVDKLEISDKIEISGQFHSRMYKKTLDSGEIEFRVAHELVVTNFSKIEGN